MLAYLPPSAQLRARLFLASSRQASGGVTAALTALLAVAGCTPHAPSGQVVARVDGVEITRRELIFEIENDSTIRNADGPEAKRMAIDALVNRKLLAAAAKRALLDRSPDFIAARRRMAEVMLTDRYIERISGEVDVASADDVSRFIASNPAKFINRQSLTIKRLSVPSEWTRGLGGTIAAADRARVAARCKTVPAECSETVDKIDTQAIAREDAEVLVQRPIGASWIATSAADDKSGRTVIATLATRFSIRNGAKNDSLRAAAMLQSERAQKAYSNVIGYLRRHAAISYQPGFQP